MTEQNFYRALSRAILEPDPEESAAKHIFGFVYTNPGRFNLHKLDEDTRSDFLLWLYPRFRKMLNRHDINKSGIISYIQSIVHWSYKSWLRTHAILTACDHAVTRYNEEAYEQERGEPVFTAEPEPAYMPSGNALRAYKNLPPKKLLILALKAGPFLSDRHITSLSRITGYSEEQLFTYFDALEAEIQKKQERLDTYIQSRNICYVRICRTMHELRQLSEGSCRYLAVQRCHQHNRKKWAKFNSQLRKMPVKISNRKIAEILEIPRTQVESALRYIKHAFLSGDIVK